MSSPFSPARRELSGTAGADEIARAVLAGSVLTGITFLDVILLDINLAQGVFVDCVFRNCAFHNSVLTSARFRGCTLEHLTLSNCSLRHAQFRACVLEDNRLRGCCLEDAVFSNSTLVAQQFLCCDGPVTISACTGNLLTFADCNLAQSCFAASALTKPYFRGCYLGQSDFSDTQIDVIDLADSVLTDTVLPKDVVKENTTICIHPFLAPVAAGVVKTKKLRANPARTPPPPKTCCGSEPIPPRPQNSWGPTENREVVYQGVVTKAVLLCSDLEEYRGLL